MSTPRTKIVLFGPPLAGKSTALVAYAHSRELKTQTGRARSITGGAEPHLLRTSKVQEGAQVATYSGSIWSIHDWKPMLQACDALVIVLDSQSDRMDTNIEHIRFLEQEHPKIRGCLLVSKIDLPTSIPTKEICRRLAIGGGPFSDWPRFESTIQDITTLLAPFRFLSGE